MRMSENNESGVKDDYDDGSLTVRYAQGQGRSSMECDLR
jgi:hypothetical protein